MKRCESAKQRGQRLRLFALKPSQNKDANFKCLRLALKLLQRWPQLWPNARSKSLQPSAPRRPLRASQAEQLRARRPLAKPKRARPPQSSAAKLWAQASAAATFTRPPFYKGARGESTKRRGQRVPQSKALSPNRQLRLQAGNVSATPSVEIAAALASTMAQRSLKVVTAVSPSLAFASLASKTAPRAKAGCEAQARATAPVSRSEALGSSQCSCNFHAANASATQLAPAAALDQRWRLNRCSLHLNYPPPLARGEVVAASPLPACASLKQLRCRRPRLLMKRRESAKRRGRRCDSLHSNRRRIRMRISSVCTAGLLSTRDQALPLSLALPGSKLKP